MEMVKNYICLLISLVFTLFAFVQYNDPDPQVWIAIYMSAAIMPILYIYKLLSKTVMITAITFYFIGFIYLWPEKYEGVMMPMQHKIEIELARESLGLLLCFFSTSWLLFLSLRRKIVKIV